MHYYWWGHCRILKKANYEVIVIDKGRGIGGRLATRRIQDEIWGESVFDYGAQFFKARDPLFKEWVDSWENENVIQKWVMDFQLQPKERTI